MVSSPFALHRDATGRIAVITFDVPGAQVNTLSTSVGEAIRGLLDALSTDSTVGAIAMFSGKEDTFIAGADIEEFVRLESQETAERLVRDAQALMGFIAACPKPIVMGIHGACLGGGLEMAMAAHYRVVTDDSLTRLGLPEVQLGLIPAAGGCQRLPRLIGVRAALDIILAGRTIRSTKARRLGLVDELVPASILRATTIAAATRLADGWRPDRRLPRGAFALLLDRNPLGRWLVYRQARTHIRRRTGGHYPAPRAALDAVRHGLARGMDAGLQREASRFAELAVGDVSRKLVQLFFATTALKKTLGVDVDASTFDTVERIGVVGAGFMGSSIAGVAALRTGVDVRLRDTEPARVAKGIVSARGVLDRRRARRRIDRHEHARRSALISGTTDGSGFGSRQLVIEAVFEDVDVKRRVIRDLEQVVSETCILASNTSTIPIARLQEGARHPERILGMHFFSPVEKMPLVEIIQGPATAARMTATVVRFARRLGKTAIVVKDAPGFWVNRILAPYLNEAGWLAQEGTPIDAIDRTMTAFGFPVGPMALLDEVGLDVAEKAAAVLAEAFGERLAPAPGLSRLVQDGRLGRKAGQGFYRYADGKKAGVDPAAVALLGVRPSGGPGTDDIERRLVLSLLNEAARALAEDVVREPRDADLGAIFGFGFPPFRGGPFGHIDDRGAGAVVRDLERLASTVGDRFAPCARLVEMASAGRRFYE